MTDIQNIETKTQDGNGYDPALATEALQALPPAAAAAAQAVMAAEFAGEFNCTDMGNAARLSHYHGDRLRYVDAWGWLAWDGKRWARDAGAAWRLAQDTVRAIYTEAGEATEDERRRELGKWAVQSESQRRLAAMLSLARWQLGIEAKPDVFDRDPWLLNCENGTLDLHTGKLHEHRPGDMITYQAGTHYDPAAECPQWEAFLSYIMAGNCDLEAFLQRAIGYTLTGDVSEQALYFLYGIGANGKSTFLEAIRKVLGDYAQQADASTFLAKARQGGINNDVAALRGARFVAAIEAGAGRYMAENLVKQMTGGDTVRARFLYHEGIQLPSGIQAILGGQPQANYSRYRPGDLA